MLAKDNYVWAPGWNPQRRCGYAEGGTERAGAAVPNERVVQYPG